jgi:hypothetical protein
LAPQLTPPGGVYNFVPRFIKPNNAKLIMKTYPLILATLLVAFACQSQPVPGAPVMQPPAVPRQYMPPPGAPPPAAAAPAREPVNYLIRVEWKEPKADPKSLEVLTTEGNFDLNTIQKNSVKINNNDVPVTLKFNGTLRELNDEKGRLQLFLGRTVPYVTSTSGSGPNVSSSYSQMSVGLQSTFVVKFGKPLVIQTDENGEISVLVKRIED